MKSFIHRLAGFAFCLSLLFTTHDAAEAQVSKAVDGERVLSTRSKSEAISLEREVFSLINRTREENGLKSLVWNETAARIARGHSLNMANEGFFSHEDPAGGHVTERAAAGGLGDWDMLGENIAYNSGFENPAERALYGWMNSAGHRQNILRANWRETGIGIAISPSGTYFFTQVFLKRK